VDWPTAIGTVIGAAIAIIGTVLAHILTTRDSRKAEHRNDQRQSYLDFALAAEAAHDRLRQVADPKLHFEDLTVAARRAVSESGIYAARERLLVIGSPAINKAAERVVQRLRFMRKAVRDGARLGTVEFHDVYHPLANALWNLRQTARREFGYEPLKPGDIDKTTWDSKDACDACNAKAALAADHVEAVDASASL
jgi:hypothetical protein